MNHAPAESARGATADPRPTHPVPAAPTTGRSAASGAVGPARGACAVAAVLAIASLGGCMIGPDYQTPPTKVNESWLEPVDSGGPIVPEQASATWWETFQDPVLDRLVVEAWRENLSLKAAGLRVLEARARRGIAVGRFFPQTQEAFGGISGNQLSANVPGGEGDRWFGYNDVGLQAVWEIDVWGKFRRGIEAADAEVLASLANYDQVLVSLVSEVGSTYVLLRSLEERLAIARSNAILQKETLDLTRIRFNAGAVSELDVTTAQATLSNTEALIPFFENAIRESTLILCVLLGRPPSTLDDLLTPEGGAAPRVPEAPPQIAVGIPADLLRRRPDVRAAERIAAAQSARIGAAETELLPRISIAGLTGFASSNFEGLRTPELGNIFDGNSFQGFIGLEVNWPILNYGRIIGAVRAQDAIYEQAATEYQDSVLRAAGEVEAGLSRFLRSRERRDRLAESVVAAKRSVELSLIQYRAGAVDFIRVNDAQTVQLQQEDLLVDARASIALGAISAYRGMGGGWEIRGDAELVDPETIQRMRDRTNWGDVLSPEWSRGSDLGFRRPRSDLEGPEAPRSVRASPVPDAAPSDSSAATPSSAPASSAPPSSATSSSGATR